MSTGRPDSIVKASMLLLFAIFVALISHSQNYKLHLIANRSATLLQEMASFDGFLA